MNVAHVLDQQIFRTLLAAAGAPGRRLPLPGHVRRRDAAPAERVVQVLLDQDCSYAVTGTGAEELGERVQRSTGARPASLQEADFLLVLGPWTEGRLRELKRGTPENPEQGATVFYLLDGANGVPPMGPFRLHGPGVRPGSAQAPEMPGLYRDELRLLGQVNGSFPLGVDAYFFDRESVMAVPRSVGLVEG